YEKVSLGMFGELFAVVRSGLLWRFAAFEKFETVLRISRSGSLYAKRLSSLRSNKKSNSIPILLKLVPAVLLNNRMPAKRKRPLIEELIKISVHHLVTNKPGAKHVIIDGQGNRLEFVDEIVGDEQRLVLYINGHQSSLSFLVADLPITGRIKNNEILWDKN